MGKTKGANVFVYAVCAVLIVAAVYNAFFSPKLFLAPSPSSLSQIPPNSVLGAWVSSITKNELRAYYDFSSVSSGKILDLSGKRNHASGASQSHIVEGRVHRGYSFETADDILLVPNSASLHSSNEIVITMWVYPKTFLSDAGVLVAKINGNIDCPSTGDVGCSDREYYVGLSSTGMIQFQVTPVSRIGIGSLNCQTPPGAVPLNKWTHVVVRASSDSETMEIYINADDVAYCSKPQLSSGIRTSNGPVSIGRMTQTSWGALNLPFTGYLDEVRIYGGKLSDSDVSDILNAPFNCENGLDDDNDMDIDYPVDGGCANLKDLTEYVAPSYHNFTICTPEDLNNVRWDLDGDYKQVCDIDLSNYTDWNPIGRNYGYPSDSFTGRYDGQNHTIKNLKIRGLRSPWGFGLFSVLERSHVSNLVIKNATFFINASLGGAGVLAAISRGSTISNVKILDALIDCGSGDTCGGLVGYSSDDFYLGHPQPTFIEFSSSSGTIKGNNLLGGLVASAELTYLSNSSSSVNVIANIEPGHGESYLTSVGGLVGYLDGGVVSSSFATGNVVGHSYIGGLVGTTDVHANIYDSFSTGNVTGVSYIGGLVGLHDYSRLSCNNLNLSYPYTCITPSTNIINKSYSTSSVSGIAWIGGLVGQSSGLVTRSYSKGKVSGRMAVGGLIGKSHYGTILDSYAQTEVNVLPSPEIIGGLVGHLYLGSKLERSYSTGYMSFGGGLIGNSLGANISSSYWDMESSSRYSSFGGIGKTTAEMKTQSTYQGWDFTNVWRMPVNDYPKLKWQS